jgi:hypothetical protein
VTLSILLSVIAAESFREPQRRAPNVDDQESLHRSGKLIAPDGFVHRHGVQCMPYIEIQDLRGKSASQCGPLLLSLVTCEPFQSLLNMIVELMKRDYQRCNPGEIDPSGHYQGPRRLPSTVLGYDDFSCRILTPGQRFQRLRLGKAAMQCRLLFLFLCDIPQSSIIDSLLVPEGSSHPLELTALSTRDAGSR